MKIVQVIFGKGIRGTNARNGGELRFWQDFESLVFLGHQVSVIGINLEGKLEAPTVQKAEQVIYLDIEEGLVNSPRFWWNPGTHLSRGRRTLAEHLRVINPDYVICGDANTLFLLPDEWLERTVYSHQDFYFRIQKIRRAHLGHHKGLKSSLVDRLARYHELDRLRKCNHVLCVSQLECRELEKQNFSCTYIPTTGPTIKSFNSTPDEHARFFLIGKSSGTAMMRSREYFFRELWDRAKSFNCEWHQVGEVPKPQLETEDWKRLVAEFKFVHGFVDDLSSVLRIGDISLTTYPENTGLRSKFITSAGYGVVNFSFVSSFESAPEFTPGKNCLAFKNNEECLASMEALIRSASLRKSLGEGARQLYEQEFTFEKIAQRYGKVFNP